jgi:hypothetical protein
MTRRSALLARSAAAVALALLLGLPAARAASPGASAAPDLSPAPDPLAASLLDQTDLPHHTGSGIEPVTDLDIDRLAFEEQRGISTLMRAWASQERGVVFDLRMLFPTPRSALAYLVAAEPTLSEAFDAGLALVTDDPPLTAATRHWAGDTIIGGERVAMDVWLIPVGPVVAKVSVTAFGPGLDDRRGIAERALARVEDAFGRATARWPGASPGVPEPRASDAAAAGLLELAPTDRVGGCGSVEIGLAGEVAALGCTLAGSPVTYRLFLDAATRDAALAELLAQVPEPDASARSCAEGPSRGELTEDGRTWSLACWESSSGLVMLWSEPDHPVLGAILAPGSFAGLTALWRAARLSAP